MSTLKELKELDQKATSAPWVFEENSTIFQGKQIASFSNEGNRKLQIIVNSFNDKEDIELIIASRNALPNLIRVIELAEEALTEIRDGMPKDDGDYYEGGYHQYRLIAEQALSEIRKLKGE